jgi:hypothetical protein
MRRLAAAAARSLTRSACPACGRIAAPWHAARRPLAAGRRPPGQRGASPPAKQQQLGGGGGGPSRGSSSPGGGSGAAAASLARRLCSGWRPAVLGRREPAAATGAPPRPHTLLPLLPHRSFLFPASGQCPSRSFRCQRPAAPAAPRTQRSGSTKSGGGRPGGGGERGCGAAKRGAVVGQGRSRVAGAPRGLPLRPAQSHALSPSPPPTPHPPAPFTGATRPLSW